MQHIQPFAVPGRTPFGMVHTTADVLRAFHKERYTRHAMEARFFSRTVPEHLIVLVQLLGSRQPPIWTLFDTTGRTGHTSLRCG